MISEEKKNKIKSSLKNTKEKRKNQIITIIKTKIDMDKLSNKTCYYTTFKYVRQLILV
jgi:putative transposase